MSGQRTLTQRELNRSLLARQGLLDAIAAEGERRVRFDPAP